MRDETNAEMFDAIAAQGKRAPIVAFPSGDEASYWHADFDDYLRFYARTLARCR